MRLLDAAARWFQGVKASPVERKVADMLGNPAGIVDDRFPKRVDGSPFVAGNSYFGVRLSGLHMVNARRFATEQLPLCVCLAEFDQGGVRRTVPFSIGPDVIRQKLKDAGVTDAADAKPAWVELRDLTVLRPTPFNDGNLSIYAGLFSVPGDDLVRTLLNVVGTVGTAVGQPAVGAGLKVAETVYDSFGKLLGLQQVSEVVATLIGNALTEAGSGYLLIANVPPDTFDPKRGRVVAGRLHWPLDEKNGAAVVEFDHALLAIERFDTVIEPATGLAPVLFEQLWSEVRKAPMEQARAALTRLQDSIAGSSDLTENDRIALLGSYSVTFNRLAEARWGAAAAAAVVTRGSGASTLASSLTSAAGALKEGSAEQDIVYSIAAAVQPSTQEWTRDPSDEAIDAAVLDTAMAIRGALMDGGKARCADAAALARIVARVAADH